MRLFPSAPSVLIPALTLAVLLALTLGWAPAASAQSENTAAPGAFAQGTEAAAPGPVVSDLAPPAAAPTPVPSTGSEVPPKAADGAPLPAASPLTGGLDFPGLEMVKALGAFILVILLLLAVLKGLGRLGRFRGFKGRASIFELRGVHALDNRKYLAALAVDGRMLVVGVTPERIIPVAQWILDPDDDQGLDFTTLPPAAKDAGLDFKLPEEPPARPAPERPAPRRPAYERPEDLDICVAEHIEDPKK